MIKTDNKVGGFFVLFVTIIVALVLASSLADNVWKATNPFTNTNDTISISGSRTVEGNITDLTVLTLHDNYVVDITSAYFRNGSIDVALTEDTDFTVDETDGEVTLIDTGKFGLMDNGNNTEFVYTHGEDYVNNSTGRTLIGLVTIFFVIGFFVFVVFYVKKNYIDEI